jgi:hypothetical protein
MRISTFLMQHSTPLLFKLAPRFLTTPISLIVARRTRGAAIENIFAVE